MWLLLCAAVMYFLDMPISQAGDSGLVLQQEMLMEARGSFKAKSARRIGRSGRRYTVTYTGPDRYFKSVRFGLYPDVGKALTYSVMSGWFYKGREYPVSFECKKLASLPVNRLRLLLDQAEYK
ncbi:MAG: hypothetical protein IME93_01535 [Proteobacteria bacterium]|nr:hypothetical protein [Pseudomonadota bacterium]